MTDPVPTDLPAARAGFVTIAERPVPRMGYGIMGLAAAVESGRIPFDDGVALLRHAFNLGVRAYDTADFYSHDTANRLLAAAFSDCHADVAYLTKVGAREPDRGPLPLVAAQRPAELRRQVEQNLATLGVDRIDLVYLRRMDQMPGLVAVRPSQRVALDDQLAELIKLRDAGTIAAIGLSNVSASQLCRALPAGIAAVSNSYNLLHRKDEPLIRLAEHEGMVWSPFFPLGGAILKRFTSVARNPKVQQAARRLDATPSQVGLAWLLAHSSRSLAIAGTTSQGHLDENVAAAGLRLPDDVLQTLDAVRR